MKRNALIIDAILDEEGLLDLKAKRYTDRAIKEPVTLDRRALRKEALEQLTPAQLQRQRERPDLIIWPDGREFQRAAKPDENGDVRI